MARPKGSKNKPKMDAPDPANDTEGAPAEVAANGLGHNKPPLEPLTEEQRQALALQWKRKYEADLGIKKAADAALKNTCKLAKAELGDDAVDLIKDMIKVATPEGEAELKAKAERARRAAIYMAADLGSQFDFFEDRMPAEDRAYAEGKRDAMAGEPLVNSYDTSVPQHDRYAEGWHAGADALKDAYRARDARVFDGVTSEEEASVLAAIERDGVGATVAAEMH